jgi:hypothetical protein
MAEANTITEDSMGICAPGKLLITLWNKCPKESFTERELKWIADSKDNISFQLENIAASMNTMACFYLNADKSEIPTSVSTSEIFVAFSEAISTQQGYLDVDFTRFTRRFSASNL